MSKHDNMAVEETNIADADTAADLLREKMEDAFAPGYEAEFDPIEAETAGAFAEDALNEQDAADSVIDVPDHVLKGEA